MASVRGLAQPLFPEMGTCKVAEIKTPNTPDVNPQATAGGSDKNKTQAARKSGWPVLTRRSTPDLGAQVPAPCRLCSPRFWQLEALSVWKDEGMSENRSPPGRGF